MVTHDQEEALCLADKMVVMNRGEIIQVGTPKEVYKNPETPFVADFIGTINFIDDGINKIAIKLDVVSKVAEQMKLCIGSKINFKIPKEGIVQYKSEGCA